jgi:hypothetical protein
LAKDFGILKPEADVLCILYKNHRVYTLFTADVIELNDFGVWRSGEVQSGRWLWRQQFLGCAIAQKPFTESKRKRHRFFFEERPPDATNSLSFMQQKRFTRRRQAAALRRGIIMQ